MLDKKAASYHVTTTNGGSKEAARTPSPYDLAQNNFSALRNELSQRERMLSSKIDCNSSSGNIYKRRSVSPSENDTSAELDPYKQNESSMNVGRVLEV